MDQGCGVFFCSWLFDGSVQIPERLSDPTLQDLTAEQLSYISKTFLSTATCRAWNNSDQFWLEACISFGRTSRARLPMPPTCPALHFSLSWEKWGMTPLDTVCLGGRDVFKQLVHIHRKIAMHSAGFPCQPRESTRASNASSKHSKPICRESTRASNASTKPICRESGASSKPILLPLWVAHVVRRECSSDVEVFGEHRHPGDGSYLSTCNLRIVKDSAASVQFLFFL